MSISVVAHRGDSEAARENTLEAFRRAVEAGVNWVELDVRTTLDGVSIVLHDATTLRLWGHPAEVSRMTLEQVRELGLADCRIPTLDEALRTVAASNAELGREVGVLVDVTDPADALAALRVTSGDHGVPIRWSGATEALLAVREADADAKMSYNHAGGELPTELLARLAPDAINVEWVLATGELVASAHRMGLSLATWTVDDAEVMSWLVELGVDSITTNRPRLLKSLLAGVTSPLALAWSGTEQLVERGVSPEMAEWVTVARHLAQWANDFTNTSALGTVRTKAHAADVVTQVDEAVERHVREVVQSTFPDHVVVGEEMGGQAQRGRPTWYLDPVDGTTNLANRLPWTSMSLALAIDERPLVAVVAHPAVNGVYLAAESLGTTHDGRPVDVRRASSLAGRTVLTELDAHLPWPGLDEFSRGVGAQHGTLRVMGSGSLAMASVGLGWAAGALVHRFNPIDHLAGALISHEAGAVVLDQGGARNLFPTSGGMLVAVPGVDEQLHGLWVGAGQR